MIRLILLTFGFLGWAFYEISGGKDFTPEVAQKTVAETTVTQPQVIKIDRSTDVVAVAKAAKAAIHQYQTNGEETVSRAAQNMVGDSNSLWRIGTQEPSEQILLASVQSDMTDLTLGLTELPTGKMQDPDNLRFVKGNSVNLRNGPGTSHGILTKLDRDTQVQLLNETQGSWVKLRVIETNRVGWLSASLLRQ